MHGVERIDRIFASRRAMGDSIVIRAYDAPASNYKRLEKRFPASRNPGHLNLSSRSVEKP